MVRRSLVLFGSMFTLGIAGSQACSATVLPGPADGGSTSTSSGATSTSSTSSGSTSSTSGSTSSTSSSSGSTSSTSSTSGSTGKPDSGPDAADAMTDASDAGGDVVLPRLPVDQNILDFASAQVKATCDRIDACCKVPEPTYVMGDRVKCESESQSGLDYGFAGFDAPRVNGRFLKLDAAKAQDCLAKVKAATCDNVGIPGTERNAIVDTCSAAIEGLQILGGTCVNDIECKAGSSCQAGKCAALLPLGAACVNQVGNYQNPCSTRGLGDTGLYCSDTCKMLEPVGATCRNSEMCASGACSPEDGLCAATFKEDLCFYYSKP
jgi:hypothetical protein